MINSVSSIPMVYNPAIQNQLSNTSMAVPQQIQNANLNGIDALGIYNQPLQKAKNLQPTLPTILQPEAIKNINGEKIYSPIGTLEAIVKKDDKNTIVYKMDIQAPENAIRKIEYYDNTTGKLTAIQENFNKIEKGKLPQITQCEVRNIDPQTGKTSKISFYENGQLACIKEIEYGPNNYKKEYTTSKNSSYIHENFGNGYRKTTIFDSKGNVQEVVNFDENNYSTEHILYKNGIPCKITKESEIKINTNPTGKNPASDVDLIPAQPYILGYNPHQVDGEKKYYSNGVLHSIKTTTQNGEITHMFDINGDLTGIEDAQNPNNVKTIIYHNLHDKENSFYTVDEEIGNKIVKTTSFNNDGSKEVTVINFNDNSEKHVKYSENGLINHYYETDKTGNGLFMSFDKQGNLISIS